MSDYIVAVIIPLVALAITLWVGSVFGPHLSSMQPLFQAYRTATGRAKARPSIVRFKTRHQRGKISLDPAIASL